MQVHEDADADAYDGRRRAILSNSNQTSRSTYLTKYSLNRTYEFCISLTVCVCAYV